MGLQLVDKRLRSLSVFLGNHSRTLSSVVSVLLGLLHLSLLLLGDLGREDIWCGKNFVKVLELLSCPQSVGVRDVGTVDLGDVGEAVHDEGTTEHSVGDIIGLDSEGGESLKGF